MVMTVKEYSRLKVLTNKVIDKTAIKSEKDEFMRMLHTKGIIPQEHYERFKNGSKDDCRWLIKLSALAAAVFITAKKPMSKKGMKQKERTCNTEETQRFMIAYDSEDTASSMKALLAEFPIVWNKIADGCYDVKMQESDELYLLLWYTDWIYLCEISQLPVVTRTMKMIADSRIGDAEDASAQIAIVLEKLKAQGRNVPRKEILE